MSNGKSFVVAHTDQVMLTEWKAVVGVLGDKERRVTAHAYSVRQSDLVTESSVCYHQPK